LTGDKAYNDYTVEDVLREGGVELLLLRKNNSHHPVPPFFTFLQASVRKMVETTGSILERLLPKSIHAVPARGFELKKSCSFCPRHLHQLPLVATWVKD